MVPTKTLKNQRMFVVSNTTPPSTSFWTPAAALAAAASPPAAASSRPLPPAAPPEPPKGPIPPVAGRARIGGPHLLAGRSRWGFGRFRTVAGSRPAGGRAGKSLSRRWCRHQPAKWRNGLRTEIARLGDVSKRLQAIARS